MGLPLLLPVCASNPFAILEISFLGPFADRVYGEFWVFPLFVPP